jgi:hypothetical protein
MKKAILFALIIVIASAGIAQQTFIRHDTIVLKPINSKWELPQPVQLSSTKKVTSKSLPAAILDAINKGSIKAFDPYTNKRIPATAIYSWHLNNDTLQSMDANGTISLIVAINTHQPDHIKEIRIYQDWFFNAASGKLQAITKQLELMEEIYASTGDLMGQQVFCRIHD